jgi:hypothetical protein
MFADDYSPRTMLFKNFFRTRGRALSWLLKKKDAPEIPEYP